MHWKHSRFAPDEFCRKCTPSPAVICSQWFLSWVSHFCQSLCGPSKGHLETREHHVCERKLFSFWVQVVESLGKLFLPLFSKETTASPFLAYFQRKRQRPPSLQKAVTPPAKNALFSQRQLCQRHCSKLTIVFVDHISPDRAPLMSIRPSGIGS